MKILETQIFDQSVYGVRFINPDIFDYIMRYFAVKMLYA